jgi:hypothetical protein
LEITIALKWIKIIDAVGRSMADQIAAGKSDPRFLGIRWLFSLDDALPMGNHYSFASYIF